MEHAEEQAARALETIGRQDIYFRSIALWVLGLTRVLKMNLDKACQVLDELLQVSKAQASTMFVVMTASQIARARMRMGELDRAEQTYLEALDAGRDRAGNLLPIAGEAMMGLGELYRELNQLDRAIDCVLEGIELSRQWRDVAGMEGYLTLSQIQQAREKWQAAQDAIDKAIALARKYDEADFDDRMVAMWQARLWIVQGRLEEAEQWAKDLEWMPADDLSVLEGQEDIFAQFAMRESVIVTRLYMAQGRIKPALQLIDTQLPFFSDYRRTSMVVELGLLKAIAYSRLDEKQLSMDALGQALEIAAPTKFLRIFLDEGPELRALLLEARRQGILPHFTDRLIHAFDNQQTLILDIEKNALTDPLSDRELEVLRFLPTNLTTPEIASEMVIGVNTVRSHIKSIYSKLGVHRRSHAVALAEELGLI
jgi:LuxR family maltose regulon positive regulatory protein